MGWCPVDGVPFVLDRAVQPWARARTCSDSCRARLGNRGRRPATCDHCVMVADFHVERERQETALENEHRQDEDAAAALVAFGAWLRHYPWPNREPDQLAS